MSSIKRGLCVYSAMLVPLLLVGCAANAPMATHPAGGGVAQAEGTRSAPAEAREPHVALAARSQAPRAAVIATVDLSALLEGLQQRSAADVAFRALSEKTVAEQQRRESDIEALRAQLADTVDPEARQRLEEDIALAAIELEYWLRLKRNELDVEWSLGRQDLFRSIEKAVKTMAEMQGYDLVVIDDSGRDFSVIDDASISRQAQLLQQVRSRRLLYANPAIDITNDLIAAMNNAYTTGTRAP